MKKTRYIFSVKIILPALLTMALFLLTFFFIVIPTFESNMMDRKRETIYELTQTACSILDKYNQEVKDSALSIEEAQQRAADEISALRYGEENKDYFWITNMEPRMIRHPYRPDLNGEDLSNFEDPQGKKLFVEFVKVVNSNGEGYVDYMWQWKDDSTRIVPKLSFVRGFKEWGWIVGTGIYIEDVRVEINRLERRMVLISLMIFGMLVMLLAFILHFSLRAERKRIQAEQNLKKSRDRYKALVEASSEGTFMLLDDEVFVNRSFINITGLRDHQDKEEIVEMLRLKEAFSCSFEDFDNLKNYFNTAQKAETIITTADHRELRILINASISKIMNRDALIIVIRPLSEVDAREMGDYSNLVLPGLRLGTFVSTFSRRSRFLDVNSYLIELLEASDRANLLNKDITEFFADAGEEHIFLKTLLRDNVIQDFTIKIKTESSKEFFASVSARIFEEEHSSGRLCSGIITPVSHLHTKNLESRQLLSALQNQNLPAAKALIASLGKLKEGGEFHKAYKNYVLLATAVLQDGMQAEKLTQMLGRFSDALLKRLIDLAQIDLGPAPAPFVYLSLGSVGRGEQSFVTDQDNAIVFADEYPTAKSYFLELGKYVSDMLADAGFHYCKGEMMATNPRWCATLSEWKAYFKEWFSNSEPQNLMEISVFFDFQASGGDERLANELQEFVHEESAHKPTFYFNMAQSILQYRAPLNLMGNISSASSAESGSLDIKMAMMPLVMLPRIYSIQHKIDRKSTFERIRLLQEKGILSADFAREFLVDYEFLMSMRLRNQCALMDKGLEPSNIIHYKSLSDLERNSLERIFSRYKLFQTQLKADFQGGLL
ncbi:MAG: cache domain-containing protein [Bacteroidales bacterium]|nr:cache domain-containing protein [Bacteroidales bacterium]